MSRRPYCEIDVFSGQPYGGNPLAVVADARGLATAQMQEFARWTNLSETVFLLPPEHPDADYRTRIFTPARELDFAGHPTLGSCQAWLLQGGQPRGAQIVQECGVGLVRLRREATGLAFCAPPLHRRAVAPDTLAATAAALGIAPAAIRDAQWLRNGPDWLSLLLQSAEQVLALDPDYAQLARIGTVGVIGPARAPGAGTGGTDFEVRGFAPGDGIPEDPVTGSLNAALGQWLTESGVAPARYRVAQGTRMGRAGRVQIVRDGADVWVGGDCHALVTGEVEL